MKNYKIGIIGGMGPQASALLHSLIIKKYSKELGVTENHQYPLIAHLSLPVVDFISDKSKTDQNLDLFAAAAEMLKVIKPDACVVACNTAHIITDTNASLRKLPLISLPESVIAAAQKLGVRKLGLIASPTTIRSKLYESKLGSSGIDIIPANGPLAKRSEAIIRKTIAGQAGKAEVEELRMVAESLRRKGAEAIALGCTELSVVAHMAKSKRDEYIDSLTAVADRLIEQVRLKQEELQDV